MLAIIFTNFFHCSSPGNKRSLSFFEDSDDEIAAKKSKSSQITDFPILPPPVDDFEVIIRPGADPDPIITLDHASKERGYRSSRMLEELLKFWSAEVFQCS